MQTITKLCPYTNTQRRCDGGSKQNRIPTPSGSRHYYHLIVTSNSMRKKPSLDDETLHMGVLILERPKSAPGDDSKEECTKFARQQLSRGPAMGI